jgi:hypothetical protein
VLFVLHLPLTLFLRVVIVPGLAAYAIAAALAWPVAQLAAAMNRWQGAGVLLAAGILYAAGVMAVLNGWVLTDAEKQKELSWCRRGLGILWGGEVAA